MIGAPANDRGRARGGGNSARDEQRTRTRPPRLRHREVAHDPTPSPATAVCGRATRHLHHPRLGKRALAALLATSVLVSAAAAASGLVATAAQAATDTHSPQGHMDALRAVPGGVTVAGWAFDPDVPTTALVIYLWTDGKLSGINANQSRPDVAALHPGIGPRHGFAATMRLPEGAHHLCAVAGNISHGTGKTLACATLTVADSPRGHVDALRAVP
ncbi:MAG: hypothetical protein DLM57_08890, partial [Pseudonocardiales bacterium]